MKKIFVFTFIFMLILTFTIQAESKFAFNNIKFKETNSENMFKVIGKIKNNTDINYDTVYFDLIAFKNDEIYDIESIIIQNIYANSEKYFVTYLYNLSPYNFDNYKLRVDQLYEFK